MSRIRATLIAGLLLCSGAACGKADPQTIDRLAKELSAKTSSERNHAALELAGYGIGAKAAVPSLVRCLRDENAGVRSSAAYALRSIGTPDAVKALDGYQP